MEIIAWVGGGTIIFLVLIIMIKKLISAIKTGSKKDRPENGSKLKEAEKKLNEEDVFNIEDAMYIHESLKAEEDVMETHIAQEEEEEKEICPCADPSVTDAFIKPEAESIKQEDFDTISGDSCDGCDSCDCGD